MNILIYEIYSYNILDKDKVYKELKTQLLREQLAGIAKYKKGKK